MPRRRSPRPPTARQRAERATRALERMRRFIAALPETKETISHGAPTFWGGKKTFANLHLDHHGDPRAAVWIKSDFDTQQALVEGDPDLFFVPPYVGPSGWIAVRVDIGRPDWRLIEGLLEDGYRRVAPQRALKRLDERA